MEKSRRVYAGRTRAQKLMQMVQSKNSNEQDLRTELPTEPSKNTMLENNEETSGDKKYYNQDKIAKWLAVLPSSHCEYAAESREKSINNSTGENNDDHVASTSLSPNELPYDCGLGQNKENNATLAENCQNNDDQDKLEKLLPTKLPNDIELAEDKEKNKTSVLTSENNDDQDKLEKTLNDCGLAENTECNANTLASTCTKYGDEDKTVERSSTATPSDSMRSTADCSVADPDFKSTSSYCSSNCSCSSSSDSEISDTVRPLASLEYNAIDVAHLPATSTEEQQANQKGRKRLRNPSNWKQNKIKRLRNSGKEYKALSGKLIKERQLKPPCNEKCKLKCTEKLNEDARSAILKSFWSLGNITLQRAFITSSLTNVVPKYKYTNAEHPRKPNQAYHLQHQNDKIRVCYKFFKNTLDISDRFIRTANKKVDENGFIHEDFRGRHAKHNEIPAELKQQIKAHIESIPRVDSHYVRADSTREYEIDGSKTISQLYRDFKDQQIELNRDAGKYITYYTIFTKEYNIGFHKPKKDQCDDCISYQNAPAELKVQLQSQHDAHNLETRLCRQEKWSDRSKITENVIVAVFDLEATLPCPKGEASSFYYKSKLNCFNFTVVELSKKESERGKKGTAYENVHCFFWTEVQGKRGANEIGSCLFEYFKNINDSATSNTTVILYSDNCCGQNKNKYVTALLLYVVQYFEKIEKIILKFLIVGHTENEGDNVHSLIEREIKRTLKRGPIYVPHDYISIIKQAKKSRPYFKVHEIDHTFFKDLKTLQEDLGFNFTANLDGDSVVWNHIKVMEFRKETPFHFYYKTSYTTNDFLEVNVRNNRRKKMKKIEEITVSNAYDEKRDLSEIKKKHLKELLKKNIIPSFYSDFYESLF